MLFPSIFLFQHCFACPLLKFWVGRVDICFMGKSRVKLFDQDAVWVLLSVALWSSLDEVIMPGCREGMKLEDAHHTHPDGCVESKQWFCTWHFTVEITLGSTYWYPRNRVSEGILKPDAKCEHHAKPRECAITQQQQHSCYFSLNGAMSS